MRDQKPRVLYEGHQIRVIDVPDGPPQVEFAMGHNALEEPHYVPLEELYLNYMGVAEAWEKVQRLVDALAEVKKRLDNESVDQMTQKFLSGDTA